MDMKMSRTKFLKGGKKCETPKIFKPLEFIKLVRNKRKWDLGKKEVKIIGKVKV